MLVSHVPIISSEFLVRHGHTCCFPTLLGLGQFWIWHISHLYSIPARTLLGKRPWSEAFRSQLYSYALTSLRTLHGPTQKSGHKEHQKTAWRKIKCRKVWVRNWIDKGREAHFIPYRICNASWSDSCRTALWEKVSLQIGRNIHPDCNSTVKREICMRERNQLERHGFDGADRSFLTFWFLLVRHFWMACASCWSITCALLALARHLGQTVLGSQPFKGRFYWTVSFYLHIFQCHSFQPSMFSSGFKEDVASHEMKWTWTILSQCPLVL